MSNFFIRNIVGTGAFQIPTSDLDISVLNKAIEAILGTVDGLEFLNARSQVINVEGSSAELCAAVESVKYDGNICFSASILRAVVEAAFLASPNISSIGTIDVKIVPEGGFYSRYPAIEYVDAVAGIVTLEDNIPPGAQIEAYKYSAHPMGVNGTYGTRNGHRYRPDRLLAKNARQLDLSTAFLTRRRAHFRFAFRWPAPQGTAGPGVRGPLGPVTVSTATPYERSVGILLCINPSPSGMGKF